MSAEANQVRIRPTDAVIAVVLLVFGLGGTGPAWHNQPDAVSPDALAYVLVGAAAVSIVVWRRLPVHVFVFTGVAIALYLALSYPFGPILLTGALAAGCLARQRPLGVVAAIGGVDAVVIGAVILTRDAVTGQVGWFDVLTRVVWVLAWVALPMAIGAAVRIRQQAGARVRQEQARRAVSEERLRMAQEVHDVVGHGLAVIAMQAGAGLHVLDRNPDRTREALEAIRTTSRESLDGLRAELAALRGTPDERSPRRPGVGLADVGVLVERVRSGGLDVRLELEQPDRSLPEELDLVAYRIVQEALTNVLRHAGPSATARVRVREARGALMVDVADSGHGPPAGGVVEGSGIEGMRDRARRVGGSVEVKAHAGGGVTVTAWLPLPAESEGSR